MYHDYDVYISPIQKKKLQTALERKKPTTTLLKISLTNESSGEKATMLLTKSQILKVENAKLRRKNVLIRMSKRQIHANLTYKGGFLSILAALASKVLPTLLTGLASGIVSGAVEKAIVKSGNGLYLQKGSHCYRVDPVEGDGLYLSPHHSHVSNEGDGLFLKNSNQVYDGKGLLLGSNSPFKNIPILGWIL